MNFTQEIINWYLMHKRDLPWRDTHDPYIIWLSEIIMQQTRVEQGMPYFHRFAENYPTVAHFASATEDEILNHWQGLGYYSRGRNMHHTAQKVMEEHAGYFPKKYDELIKLKGIGEYTAAAISSFSANEAKAVVDGNVFRLLARYFGLNTPINTGAGKKLFTELANQLIDKNQPGTYNQAAMEFGSLQCKPVKPHCPACPLLPGCQAYKQNRIDELPVKIKSQKIRNRHFNYIVAHTNRGILLHKRGPNDIWQHLHQLPLFETPTSANAVDIIQSADFKNIFGPKTIIKNVSRPPKHLLSHQRLHAQFIEIDNFTEPNLEKHDWFWATTQDLKQLAQPKLIFEFLEKFL
ncbi:MAG TPA: A/G-specific adenine glycosylase [Daejeonella sp.]|nr:A/G-specific adenine glycosylase [Daejeonella sp.]